MTYDAYKNKLQKLSAAPPPRPNVYTFEALCGCDAQAKWTSSPLPTIGTGVKHTFFLGYKDHASLFEKYPYILQT